MGQRCQERTGIAGQHRAEVRFDHGRQQISLGMNPCHQPHEADRPGPLPCDTESRGEECLQQVFQCRRLAARGRPAFRQQPEALLVDGRGPADNHRLQQSFFRVEVIVDRRQIDAGGRHNAAQRCSGIASLGKELFGSVEDSFLRVRHVFRTDE